MKGSDHRQHFPSFLGHIVFIIVQIKGVYFQIGDMLGESVVWVEQEIG